MIEIMVYISSMITFFWVGYQTGNKMPSPGENLSKSEDKIFEEGYVKGYGDCLTHVNKSTKKYYDDFPNMGIN
jgi:hypothetical protein